MSVFFPGLRASGGVTCRCVFPAVGWKIRLYVSLRGFDIVSGIGIIQERIELSVCDLNDSYTLRLFNFLTQNHGAEGIILVLK